MKSYAERYEDFTAATIKIAEMIESANKEKIANVKYSLPKITYTLRKIYKTPEYHNTFVGSQMSENKWSSGFCAMASLIVYEMYGGADIWDLMAIRYDDWGISSVVFLRDKTTGLTYATTGEHFYPIHVPYEIGKPLNVEKLRTPNKDAFRSILLKELERN